MLLWNQAFISNGFQDIQWRMWCNSWHDLNTTCKQRSRSFIVAPCTTSYRLPI